jgi:citrate synthase
MLQTGSTLVDPYSAVAASTAALYGPLHGGANEAVIRMLMRIGSPAAVPNFIERVKEKKEVLSGFGHRVYKTSDPRSFIIRKTADEVRLSFSSFFLYPLVPFRFLLFLVNHFLIFGYLISYFLFFFLSGLCGDWER